MLSKENERTKKQFILKDLQWAGHSDARRAFVGAKWGLEDDKVLGMDDEWYERGSQAEL